MLLRAKKIIKYFQKESYAKLANDSAAFQYEKLGINGANRSYFLEFLVLQTSLLKKIENPRKRRNQINDAIDFCISRGYFKEKKLMPNATSWEKHLILEIPGKEFVQPLFFLNAVLKEYGYIITILLSGVFWALIFFLGDKIVIFIKNIITKFI